MLRQIIHDAIRDAEAAAAIARDRAGLCDSGQAALRETFLTIAGAIDGLVDVTKQVDMAATINHDTIVYREQA